MICKVPSNTNHSVIPLPHHCPGAQVQSGVWDGATGESGQETSQRVEEPLPPQNSTPHRVGARRTLPWLQGDSHPSAERHRARHTRWEEPSDGRKALLSAGTGKNFLRSKDRDFYSILALPPWGDGHELGRAGEGELQSPRAAKAGGVKFSADSVIKQKKTG